VNRYSSSETFSINIFTLFNLKNSELKSQKENASQQCQYDLMDMDAQATQDNIYLNTINSLNEDILNLNSQNCDEETEINNKATEITKCENFFSKRRNQ
jgi:hypothetical protein